MDEQRAIALCLKHRDPIGFEYLVEKFRREAYAHAYALLGEEQDALDACQESFSKAFAAIPRLSELTRFYPWFYRILRNCCLNMLSRRQTRDRYAASGGASHEAGTVEWNNPSGQLVQQEERAAVWEALKQLRPEFREILCLKYFQGRSYEEIGALLGLARGTVMSRLYHARIAFKELYEKQDFSLTTDENRKSHEKL